MIARRRSRRDAAPFRPRTGRRGWIAPPLVALPLVALPFGCHQDPRQQAPASGLADVLAVEATGEPGAYTFAVTVSSPDEGCDHYAAWWEVVDVTGETLHHRRILMHSHADEQPFTRTGGPIDIAEDEVVVVRAWMHPQGYGGQARTGSVDAGFTPTELDADFGEALAGIPPLPEDCVF